MGENSSLTHGLTATSDHRFGNKLWKYREERFSQPSDVYIPPIWRSNSHSQKHHHVTFCQKTYRGCLSTDQIISSMKMTFI